MKNKPPTSINIRDLDPLTIAKKLVAIRNRFLLSQSNIHPSVISFSRNLPTNDSDWQGAIAHSK